MLSYRRRYIKQYPYIKTTQPVIVTPDLLALVKEHLRYSSTGEDDDAYLILLIQAAFEYAETYTNRTLITTEYKTYRDSFDYGCFILRRSPFQEIISIQYYDKNGDLQTMPIEDYYLTIETYYPKILRVTGKKWDFKLDARQQSIEITFIAGYGDNYTFIPKDFLMAILQHITKMFESRGDCDGDVACSSASLPSLSKMIYNKYKIIGITVEENCGCDYGKL